MANEVSRTEKLLAQLLVLNLKDAPLGEQALYLSRAGFEPGDIADLLGTTRGNVSQQLYIQRKGGVKKKRPKK